MANKYLKVYTKGELVKSKPIKNVSHYHQLIFEADVLLKARAIYLCDGKTSRRVDLPLNNQKRTRPICYTRLDGVKVFTLSVHPKHYPMVAHWPDGTQTFIEL